MPNKTPDKMLRGCSPLTTVRGVSGSFLQPLYRNQVIDPAVVDVEDRDRLIEGGHLAWVVRDGDGWKLAQDTADESAGDAVSVGGAPTLGRPVQDPGTVNSATAEIPAPKPPVSPNPGVAGDPEREAARAKLPSDGSPPDGRASKAVWVEYGVAQGRDRAALEALGRDELQAELRPKG